MITALNYNKTKFFTNITINLIYKKLRLSELKKINMNL